MSRNSKVLNGIGLAAVLLVLVFAVVVPLLDPSISSGCTAADGALIQDIIDYPDQYYVNVHTAEHPAGAIRGQLSNPGQSK